MKKIVLILSIILIATIAGATNIDSLFSRKKKTRYDSTRIIDYSDKLNIYTGLFGKFQSVELTHSELDKKLKLEPNGKASLGLGFNYKWIGLGFTFSPGFLNKDDDLYGKTKSFDTQLNLYTNSFNFDVYFQYYKGLYVKNPDDFISWNNDWHPLRPDMETFSIGASAYYFTNNKNFSYKAAYKRTQIQKRSDGSFVTGIYASINTAYAPNGLIPSELPDSLNNYYNIVGYKTGTIGFSAGYTYTLVIKRVFLNGSLVPGIGVRTATFWADNVETKQDATLTGSLAIRLTLGYEGKNMYGGIRIVSLVDTYKYETIDISSSTGNVSLYFGKRFNIKKPFKKRKK